MEMVSTPRLCIDGRIALDSPQKGLVAQEVIEQLVAGRGEPGRSSVWIEKNRTVLLTHPSQVFAGQLKRFDTKTKTPAGLISWIWEKNFIKSSQISAFHRFLPVDRLHPTPRCRTVTTLLPPEQRMPFFISRRTNQFYVVPSVADKKTLTKNYHLEQDQVFLVPPSVRRYVHHVEKFQRLEEEYVVFLVGDKNGFERIKKLEEIIRTRYSGLKTKIFQLKDREVVQPNTYLKLLQGAKMTVYLASSPFDWGTLALESLYWGIPTLFADHHHALNELLPHSNLRLSQFLVDLPEAVELKLKTQTARIQLDAKGVFDPLGFAKHYTEVYQSALPL